MLVPFCGRGADHGIVQVKRENDIVFCQRVPSEIPEMPPPKRLVKPLSFALPPPAPEAMAEALERVPGPSQPAPAAAFPMAVCRPLHTLACVVRHVIPPNMNMRHPTCACITHPEVSSEVARKSCLTTELQQGIA